MKSNAILIGFYFLFISCAGTAEENVYSSKEKIKNFELHCLLSGGMKQVHCERRMFTVITTHPKKPINQDPKHVALHQSLLSFVEIQRKTRLSKSQIEQLSNWVNKYNITKIKPVEKPEQPDKSSLKYPGKLKVFVSSKEYKIDHHTIKANPHLQEAFKELFDMAKEFTATE